MTPPTTEAERIAEIEVLKRICCVDLPRKSDTDAILQIAATAVVAVPKLLFLLDAQKREITRLCSKVDALDGGRTKYFDALCSVRQELTGAEESRPHVPDTIERIKSLKQQLSDAAAHQRELEAELSKSHAEYEAERKFIEQIESALSADCHGSIGSGVMEAITRLRSQLLLVTGELNGERKRLVCYLCESPAEWSSQESVWRHKGPVHEYFQQSFCSKYGYPIEVKPIDTVAGEAPADTQPDPEVALLQGELNHRCKEYRILSDDYEELEAERDQLLARQERIEQFCEWLQQNDLDQAHKELRDILDSFTEQQPQALADPVPGRMGSIGECGDVTDHNFVGSFENPLLCGFRQCGRERYKHRLSQGAPLREQKPEEKPNE